MLISLRKFRTFILTWFYLDLKSVLSLQARVYGCIEISNRKKFLYGRALRLNSLCYIQSDGGVRVGNNVTISARVMILTKGIELKKFLSVNRSCDYHYSASVTIGSNVWISAGAIILPGVTISGSNVIVGAGSIVNKSFSESNVLIAGNPAKIVKYLNI